MIPFWPKASITTARPLARRLLLLGALSILVAAAPTRRPNRLAAEKSPYLLRHAHNPVDWHPWGPEAFAKARREDKPVFLSIGYSTCHWCRVMERESFEDESIAAILNEDFVAVKVDREERPDIDRVYMDAAAIAGWDTGWPLNLWLTPDLKPFFAGTYFPPSSREGRLGLKEALTRVAQTWRAKRDDAVADAESIGRELEARSRSVEHGNAPAAAVLDQAFQAFSSEFDPAHGGFGDAPKFPRPAALGFLLRYSKRTGRAEGRRMLERSLLSMANGGIHDQLGGGFHRYASDAAWRSPHFEKMLYDNAQLAGVYLEAYQATRDARFARVARETLDYLLRDMARGDGGFYSAENADSAYYLWREAEVTEILGEPAGRAFSARFGVGKDPGVLYVAVTGAPAGRDIDESREALHAARLKRPRPARDDKIITAWNGLALSALAKGAQVLEEPRYLRAAQETARFIRDELQDAAANRLYRRWRHGERAIPGFAEDYALTVSGLLDLYEADFDRAWLMWAVRLSDAQLELFYDRSHGGFYATAAGQDPDLPVRSLEDVDGDIPAAGSAATLNLLRLGALAHRPDFTAAAQRTLARMNGPLSTRPQSLPTLLSAMDARLAEPLKIDLAGTLDAPRTRALLREIRRRYLPNKTVRFTPGPGRAKALVCRGKACALPTDDPAVLGRLLDGESVATFEHNP